VIDWSLILNRLRSSRGSLQTVAREVGASAQHLNCISRCEVQQPKFLVGVKLLDLHFEDYPDQHQELRL